MLKLPSARMSWTDTLLSPATTTSCRPSPFMSAIAATGPAPVVIAAVAGSKTGGAACAAGAATSTPSRAARSRVVRPCPATRAQI